MKFFRFIVVFGVSWLFSDTSAFAAKRVALVIGNGAYERVSKLPNPPRDAAAIANLLQKSGFDTVQLKPDLNGASLRKALRDFSVLAQDSDIAVVFYAGHGIEVNGTNYLIPTDAVLERDLDVEDETVSLDRVIQYLEPAKKLRLVIVDACRDNPFASGIKRTIATRSIGRGLAGVEVQIADTMIAFSAKPGSTAADGQGANSPYTTALLNHLATPGLDVRLAMGRVRDEVIAATGQKQEPIVFASLGGAETPLVPGNLQATVVVQPTTPIEALPQDKRLIVTEKGIGPLTKESALDLAAVKRVFPEFDVKLKVNYSEGNAYPLFTLSKSGKRAMELSGDDGHLYDVMVYSSDILDSNGVRVGTTFGDLPRAAIKDCTTGADEFSDKVICGNSFSPAIQYWFIGHKLNIDGDQPVNPSKIPSFAKIWAIRWAPALGSLSVSTPELEKIPASISGDSAIAPSANSMSDAAQPSFDCKKAATSVEREICNNTKLSRLDQQMADLYKNLVSTGKEKERRMFSDQRKVWQTQRDQCAGAQIQSCLTESYNKRIFQLIGESNLLKSTLKPKNLTPPFRADQRESTNQPQFVCGATGCRPLRAGCRIVQANGNGGNYENREVCN